MSVELKFNTYIDETQRLYKNLCRIYSEHGIDREMENLCEKYNSISSEWVVQYVGYPEGR